MPDKEADSKPTHINCFRDSGKSLKTSDGADIKIWELDPPSEEIKKAWAKSFRQNYCNDEEIDSFRSGTGFSRKEYLEQLIFPDQTSSPGPSIRSGDFAELLITDYVQFVQNYWVPRMKYSEKASRNESVKGVDIVGFKCIDIALSNPKDVLMTFEVKAQSTGKSYQDRLQTAIDDSSKDYIRIAQTLNATKQRLIRFGNHEKANLVERFQNLADKPYIYKSGAAAVITNEAYDESLIQSNTKVSEHQNVDNLELVIFKSADLMSLVNSIYECAANEA